jgi:hypothetical protein
MQVPETLMNTPLVQHEVLSVIEKATALCDKLSAQGADSLSLAFIQGKLHTASEKLHLMPLQADDIVGFMNELTPTLPVLALLTDRSDIRGTELEAGVNALFAYIEAINALASGMILLVGFAEGRTVIEMAGNPKDAMNDPGDLPPEVLSLLKAEGAQNVKVVHLGAISPENMESLFATLKRMSEDES